MAATSQPDQVDYTVLSVPLLYLLVLAVHAIIPTKIWPALNPDFSTRLHWLDILIHGIITILCIPFLIYMNLNRPAALLSHAPWKDFFFEAAMIFPSVLVWVIFWTKMIACGLQIIYRRRPTWFPYLMEVDTNFAKDLETEEGDEAKDLKHVSVKS